MPDRDQGRDPAYLIAAIRPRHTGTEHRPEEPPLIAQPLQQEIDREQSRVDELYALLDALRLRTRRSLEEVRRAPLVPTPAGRGERDGFDALHTERLAQLASVEDRLTFGRLDLTTGERRYIGRIGLSDADQRQLLLDWRAPAASAFYQATAATPQQVIRRRHLGLRGRTVTSLDDEVLDADALAAALAEGRTDVSIVAGEGALMTALNSHRTGAMRDIVATLQSEQDRIVRAELPGVLVVQGGPGTGKTAVALHRAAYLLYTHRDRIARSGVLVIGPSPVFLEYIEQVLPSLGETGVVLSTPGQLFPGVEATIADPPQVAVLKGDLLMTGLLKAALRRRQRTISATIELNLDGDRVLLRPSVVSEARGRARQSGRPHNEARNTFVRVILDDLATQLANLRRMAADEERGALIEELRESIDVRREINLLWMPLTAKGFVRDLLTKPAKLNEASGGLLSPAQRKLLLRSPQAPWTLGDVALLDEAAELIGEDIDRMTTDRYAAAVAAAERAEALTHARKVLHTSGDVGAMLTPEMLVDRFMSSGKSRSVAEMAASDRSWTYGHAVIDEAQELSPMQWRMIQRRIPNSSMTVVGDVAQTGSAAGTTSWARVLDPLVGGRWRQEELTVNYRTPATVMDVATAVMHAAGIEVAPNRTARAGDYPPVALRAEGREPEQVAATVAQAVRADQEALGDGRFGVVAPAGQVRELAVQLAAVLGEAYGDRVSVLGVNEVKGLEYDSVIVVDPMAIVNASPRGVNDLYVALTRPTQRLSVVHHGKLPAGLRSLTGPAPVRLERPAPEYAARQEEPQAALFD